MLKPILLQEGRKPPPSFKTRGIQAGEDDFDDGHQYRTLGKLNFEYQMVILDWTKTPIFHILTRDVNTLKAICKYTNKETINRLAGDLRERKEFEERTNIRQRRAYNRNK